MLSAPANDRRIISDRFYCLFGMPDRANTMRSGRPLHAAAELDVIDDRWPFELPGIAEGKPLFRVFLLPAVSDHLAEESMIVADPIAVGRNSKRRHAFHKACRQPAEAA